MFIAVLFIVPKIWKQLSVHQWMSKEAVVCIFNGVPVGHKKELNFAICNNVGRLGRHYA